MCIRIVDILESEQPTAIPVVDTGPPIDFNIRFPIKYEALSATAILISTWWDGQAFWHISYWNDSLFAEFVERRISRSKPSEVFSLRSTSSWGSVRSSQTFISELPVLIFLFLRSIHSEIFHLQRFISYLVSCKLRFFLFAVFVYTYHECT